MNFLIFPLCWVAAFILVVGLFRPWSKKRSKFTNSIFISFCATLFVWLVVAYWGDVGIRWYLYRFDLDGNGFVEGRELTEAAIAAEPDQNDTWRLGFAVLAPIVFGVFALFGKFGRLGR